ncbi:MAG: leucine-rich repeat domain-containing protein [Ruminococcus flavefaciens]|nr:leucine-rich repeat domain-containing protein [Ruminococcus flavefaciens]MCM1229884.1 leucine-rich repeat domain-containing protein [Ruminococcus flavefaciens]
MQCEICNAELIPGDLVCNQCGAPILQNVEGFENTMAIQRILRKLIVENFRNSQVNARSLIALLRDYLTDFKPECRLLIYTIESGVLKNMLAEENKEIAVMRARSCLISECFISEMAAEFVLVCLTYMLKWPYKIHVVEEKHEEAPVVLNKKSESSESVRVNVPEMVLRPIDAVKFRLSKNIVISKNYTKIEGFCFDKYKLVRTVKLPPTIIEIGEYSFSSCKHLRLIELPDSVRLIHQGAFSQCTELEKITIPSGVIEIEDNTFLCCESLEIVEIPTTVSSIGMQAFSGCEKLKKLYLPDSIKFIDENAFLYCPELTIRCYENSYAHRYCIDNNIKVETVPVGKDLRAEF